ncbi:MAG: hypothetical protein Kow00114_29240 [Kiloniellaceae bacterium]
MSPKLTKVLSAAVFAAAAFLVAAQPADARDWRQSMQRHYSAAEEAKYTPKGDNPQWDFNLGTVMNDMEWRARTATMLRDLPKPGETPRHDAPDGQLADRPEPPRFRFAF